MIYNDDKMYHSLLFKITIVQELYSFQMGTDHR